MEKGAEREAVSRWCRGFGWGGCHGEGARFPAMGNAGSCCDSTLGHRPDRVEK